MNMPLSERSQFMNGGVAEASSPTAWPDEIGPRSNDFARQGTPMVVEGCRLQRLVVACASFQIGMFADSGGEESPDSVVQAAASGGGRRSTASGSVNHHLPVTACVRRFSGLSGLRS